MLGRRRSLRLEEAAGGSASLLRHVDSAHLIRSILLSTLSIEAVGAVFLWMLWQFDMGARGALWPAIFHAVSAFCNAGFGTFSDSLVPFRESPATLVRKEGKLIGIVSRYDVLQQLIGTR